jgi:hypothetical protein
MQFAKRSGKGELPLPDNGSREEARLMSFQKIGEHEHTTFSAFEILRCIILFSCL